MARFVTLGGQRLELPRGVEVRQGAVRIGFTWRGRRYYETLFSQATPENVRKAGTKRLIIAAEIEDGAFDYRRHFPDSKHALVDTGDTTRPNVTLGEMLAEELGLAAERKAPSTMTSERPRHRHLLEFFGKHQPVRYLTVEDVERFKRELKRTHSAKTVNNTLGVLRSVLKRAYHRGVLARPLHDRFDYLPADETRPKQAVRPLTLAELDAIAGAPVRAAERDLVLFNCWVGLSVSELAGLAWEDVDTTGKVWRLRIRRARVGSAWKVPKEPSRVRTLELNAKAQAYLAAQRARTQLLSPMTVDVLQRDNGTKVQESIRPVWRTASGAAWNRNSLGGVFARLCRAAGIAERGANQMRHTFASRMLTAGLPVHMLAHMLGHTGESQIRRHYGRWIDSDAEGRLASLMDAAIATLALHEDVDGQKIPQ